MHMAICMAGIFISKAVRTSYLTKLYFVNADLPNSTCLKAYSLWMLLFSALWKKDGGSVNKWCSEHIGSPVLTKEILSDFYMKCWKKVLSLLWTWKMFSGIWLGTWEFYDFWLFQACIKIVHYKSEGTAKWFGPLLQTLKFHPSIIYAQIVTCLACEMWYIWYLLPVFCGTYCCLPGI
jgi:hypothetical protein